MYLIGIDIGGTNLKAGLISDKKLIDKIIVPTNYFDIIKQVISVIDELLGNNNLLRSDVQGISVGYPGMVINGKIASGSKFKLDEFDFQEYLQSEIGTPVVIKNDADLAVLAEKELGEINSKNIVMITLGTGVGGGIIINNQLYEGSGGAGELGHVIFEKNGKKCNCGRNGCVENYISLRALSNRAKEIMSTMPNNIKVNGNEVMASSILKAYESGDDCAKIILNEYVENLTEFVLDLCNIFRPDTILIGGGLSYAPKIIENVAFLCKKQQFGLKNSPEVDIKCAKLGNDAGILGACAIFK